MVFGKQSRQQVGAQQPTLPCRGAEIVQKNSGGGIRQRGDCRRAFLVQCRDLFAVGKKISPGADVAHARLLLIVKPQLGAAVKEHQRQVFKQVAGVARGVRIAENQAIRAAQPHRAVLDTGFFHIFQHGVDGRKRRRVGTGKEPTAHRAPVAPAKFGENRHPVSCMVSAIHPLHKRPFRVFGDQFAQHQRRRNLLVAVQQRRQPLPVRETCRHGEKPRQHVLLHLHVQVV